jgi:hypothetical protein
VPVPLERGRQVVQNRGLQIRLAGIIRDCDLSTHILRQLTFPTLYE